MYSLSLCLLTRQMGFKKILFFNSAKNLLHYISFILLNIKNSS